MLGEETNNKEEKKEEIKDFTNEELIEILKSIKLSDLSVFYFLAKMSLFTGMTVSEIQALRKEQFTKFVDADDNVFYRIVIDADWNEIRHRVVIKSVEDKTYTIVSEAFYKEITLNLDLSTDDPISRVTGRSIREYSSRILDAELEIVFKKLGLIATHYSESHGFKSFAQTYKEGKEKRFNECILQEDIAEFLAMLYMAKHPPVEG